MTAFEKNDAFFMYNSYLKINKLKKKQEDEVKFRVMYKREKEQNQ